MAYQFQSRIRYSETDENKKLTLPGIVDYFQDCSTFQSEELGVGLDVLAKRHRAWILAYWHIVVDRYPQFGEKIVTETWPYGFKGFYGERNFRMTDAQGKTLASAASLWIYLNTDKGHPARLDQDICGAYQLEAPLPMKQTSRKVSIPEDSEEMDSFAVMRSHLDTNHHVNNGQYILMAKEYLPQDFVVGQVRIEYKRSAVLHDVIVPFVYENGETCTVSLCGSDEKPYAVAEFIRA